MEVEVFRQVARSYMLQAMSGQLKKGVSYSSVAFGLSAKAMKWMVTLMGKDVWKLPMLVGVAFEQRLPIKLPPLRDCIAAGVPLADAYLGQEQPTGMGTNYEMLSPLHMATGLVKYGKLDNTELVKELVSPDFLEKVFSKSQPWHFENISLFNPYAPEELGLERLPDMPFLAESIGSALWFEEEYLQRNLRMVEVDRWYIDTARVRVCAPNRHAALTQRALNTVYMKVLKKTRMPDNSVGLYRGLTPSAAREAAIGLYGVREVLGLSRKDATPREMLRGLRVAAQKHTSYLAYLGRPLTIEDVKGLKPADLLMVLYYAPFDAVKDLLTKHRDTVLAEMFTLLSTDYQRISQMTTPHAFRYPSAGNRQEHTFRSTRVPAEKSGYHYTYYWTPDEPENLLYALGRAESADTLRELWEATVRPQVEMYEAQFTWRNRLLAIADIETLFLGFLLWDSGPDDVVHTPAVEAILRAHPSFHEIRRAIMERPGRKTPEQEETKAFTSLFSIPQVE